jgi:Zn-dependent M16 (insulinase) family peptidase
MELNGPANIKMLIQLYTLGDINESDLLKAINEQCDLTMEYLKEIDRSIKENKKIPYWYEIKTKVLKESSDK